MSSQWRHSLHHSSSSSLALCFRVVKRISMVAIAFPNPDVGSNCTLVMKLHLMPHSAFLFPSAVLLMPRQVLLKPQQPKASYFSMDALLNCSPSTLGTSPRKQNSCLDTVVMILCTGIQKLGAGANSRNLWISGLSSTTRATDLKQLFSKHGKVMYHGHVPCGDCCR